MKAKTLSHATRGYWGGARIHTEYIRIPGSGGAPVVLEQLPISLPEEEYFDIILTEIHKNIELEISESFSIKLIEQKNHINNIEIIEHFDVIL